MAEHFEDRHREARRAAEHGQQGGWTDFQSFDYRTGPLVDDLVAAVREMLSTPIGSPLFVERALRLLAPLEALDEASRG